MGMRRVPVKIDAHLRSVIIKLHFDLRTFGTLFIDQHYGVNVAYVIYGQIVNDGPICSEYSI